MGNRQLHKLAAEYVDRQLDRVRRADAAPKRLVCENVAVGWEHFEVLVQFEGPE